MDFTLGRVQEHDELSWGFRVASRSAEPETKVWDHTAPVHDQGRLGSCTGNALAQFLNCDMFERHPNVSSADAVKLYSLATRLDRFPGEYPPQDTGSSGLAVCKAGKRMGYLSEYRWAFGVEDVIQALQSSPLITGTMWREGMFHPDDRGFIKAEGRAVGGHEYVLLGVDMEEEYLVLLNSWGAGWGFNGRARISFLDYERVLKGGGDATIPVPLSTPPEPEIEDRRPENGDLVLINYGGLTMTVTWSRRYAVMERLRLVDVVEVLL